MNFKYTILVVLFLSLFSLESASGFIVTTAGSLTGFDVLSEADKTNTGLDIESETLVVLQDVLGEVVYSKVIVTGNSENFYTAIDPYKNISAGTYMVIGSTNNDLYFQKMVIQ